MHPSHWQVLLMSTEDGEVAAQLLEETPDGLDLIQIAACTFGPFDTAKDVTDWLLRKWSPRASRPLR